MNADIDLIDARPGAYYVSVIDGNRRALLAGPWPTHREALAMVDTVSAGIIDKWPEAHWYAFGTARVPDGDSVPVRFGSQNHLFGLPTCLETQL